VPHLTVLEHATAFVCQSGHGSLMEAFHQGVPVVVVPHQLDQRATARQVADLGLGRLIAPEDLDGHALRAAVDEVAADQGTRRRVQEMRRALRAAPGAAVVADRLEAVMDARPPGRTAAG
jgi:MGT family glycosyltransferase